MCLETRLGLGDASEVGAAASQLVKVEVEGGKFNYKPFIFVMIFILVPSLLDILYKSGTYAIILVKFSPWS